MNSEMKSAAAAKVEAASALSLRKLGLAVEASAALAATTAIATAVLSLLHPPDVAAQPLPISLRMEDGRRLVVGASTNHYSFRTTHGALPPSAGTAANPDFFDSMTAGFASMIDGDLDPATYTVDAGPAFAGVAYRVIDTLRYAEVQVPGTPGVTPNPLSWMTAVGVVLSNTPSPPCAAIYAASPNALPEPGSCLSYAPFASARLQQAGYRGAIFSFSFSEQEMIPLPTNGACLIGVGKGSNDALPFGKNYNALIGWIYGNTNQDSAFISQNTIYSAPSTYLARYNNGARPAYSYTVLNYTVSPNLAIRRASARVIELSHYKPWFTNACLAMAHSLLGPYSQVLPVSSSTNENGIVMTILSATNEAAFFVHGQIQSE